MRNGLLYTIYMWRIFIEGLKIYVATFGVTVSQSINRNRCNKYVRTVQWRTELDRIPLEEFRALCQRRSSAEDIQKRHESYFLRGMAHIHAVISIIWEYCFVLFNRQQSSWNSWNSESWMIFQEVRTRGFVLGREKINYNCGKPMFTKLSISVRWG